MSSTVMSFQRMTEQDWQKAWTFQRDRAEAAEARVRELENTTMSLDAVRRDVEARTIEQCAEAAIHAPVNNCYGAAAAIRALIKWRSR